MAHSTSCTCDECGGASLHPAVRRRSSLGAKALVHPDTVFKLPARSFFCAVCKVHVTARDQEEFAACGHVGRAVRRLQRDPGRKQREAAWQLAA